MRINRYVALATGISRRQADKLIQGCKVFINDRQAMVNDHATSLDRVVVDKKQVFLPAESTTVLLNKPVGYVVSRDGQGSKTVYDLLPAELHSLKAVGRLDKDSSGLLVLTDDGNLAHELTHPKFEKVKVYEIRLNKPLSTADIEQVVKHGVTLEDGPSRFRLDPLNPENTEWKVTMKEGRNRQIRRTFSRLNYTVKKLHRVTFGDYTLKDIPTGQFKKA